MVLGDVMVKGKEVKKNKKASNSSHNAKRKTIEKTTLSSEELLEQILNKKREKQVKKSASVSSAKKTTAKKTAVKKTVKTEVADSALLLEQILEKNKAKRKKKAERKSKKTSGRLLVDSNTVENKIVQEIIKIQEQEKQEQEEDLIITKEINLQEYLKEQNELPPRDDFIELEKELYPVQKTKKEKVKEKIDTFKQDRKVKRTAKYEKEIEKKLERRKARAQKTLEKSKIDYKYQRRILPGVLVAVTCVALVICVSVLLINKPSNAVKLEQIDVSSNLDLAAVKAMQEICLTEGFNGNDNNEQVNNFVNELNGFLSKYNASVYYYDFEKGFSYSYKVSDSYYSASLVKLIPALYIYEKANNGELDLDKTLTYTSNYNYTDSTYFDKARYGTKISIRNVVKYSLIYSDNSAYMMLIDYIGRNTLKQYGVSLGISKYMDTDNFGHINAAEAINVVKRLNSLLSVGSGVTNELKSYLTESDKNYLKLEEEGINAATKYGETYPNFHEYGIVYDEHPYGIVILTRDMGKDYEAEIKAINKKINELHRMYYQNRIDNCSVIAK